MMPIARPLTSPARLFPQALVDPIMMPIVRPLMDFIAKLMPRFLRNKVWGVGCEMWMKKTICRG